MKKTGVDGTTLYIGRLFETRPGGTMICHLYAGETPIGDVITGSQASSNYFITDHLGSVSIVADANGDKLQETVYGPFGESVFTEGAALNSRRYTGQIEDAAVGLHYYNARYYNQALGRFISADPIVPSATDPQSLNRYTYVRNNPIRHTDPTGHRFKDELRKFVNSSPIGFTALVNTFGPVMGIYGGAYQGTIGLATFGAAMGERGFVYGYSYMLYNVNSEKSSFSAVGAAGGFRREEIDEPETPSVPRVVPPLTLASAEHHTGEVTDVSGALYPKLDRKSVDSGVEYLKKKGVNFGASASTPFGGVMLETNRREDGTSITLGWGWGIGAALTATTPLLSGPSDPKGWGMRFSTEGSFFYRKGGGWAVDTWISRNGPGASFGLGVGIGINVSGAVTYTWEVK